jgi:hypothetical protein
MDLRLYGKVLLRFRWLVVAGVVSAFALAFLSIVRVSPDGIAYRKQAVWESKTLLLITQPGFPWGRSVLPSSDSDTTPRYADPYRFASLTDLYSQFANSDQVKAMMRREGAPKTWKIVATPVEPSSSQATLPVIALAGHANSANDATAAVESGRRAFLKYVASQQQVAAIPPEQRISIQVLQKSTPPKVILPRSKTLPIIILLAVLSATVGLVLVLENLRPQASAVAPTTDADLQVPGDHQVPTAITGTRATA